jgi:hypothetical protein
MNLLGRVCSRACTFDALTLADSARSAPRAAVSSQRMPQLADSARSAPSRGLPQSRARRATRARPGENATRVAGSRACARQGKTRLSRSWGHRAATRRATSGSVGPRCWRTAARLESTLDGGFVEILVVPRMPTDACSHRALDANRETGARSASRRQTGLSSHPMTVPWAQCHRGARRSADPRAETDFRAALPSRRRAAPTSHPCSTTRAGCLRVRCFAAASTREKRRDCRRAQRSDARRPAEKSGRRPTPGPLQGAVFNGTFAQGLTGWFERR